MIEPHRSLHLVRIAAAVQAAVLLSAPAVSQTPTTQPGSHPAPTSLSLSAAISTALSNSKQLKQAEIAAAKSGAGIAAAQAGFYPQLSLNASQTHLGVPVIGRFALPGAAPLAITLSRQDQTQAGLAVIWPIDVAGLVRARVQSSQLQQLDARLEINRVRNVVTASVRSAYLSMLRAQASRAVTLAARQNAQTRLATAQKFRGAGVGTQFDVLRAQTDVANAQQADLAAQNGINLAESVLDNALGLDTNTPLTLAQAAALPKAPASFDTALSTAYRLRPEPAQADTQIALAKRGVQLARASLAPQVSLGYTFEYTPESAGLAPQDTEQAIVAQISLPVFDGWEARSKAREAHDDVQAATTAKASVMDTIALQVKEAWLTFRNAADRLAVTHAALVEAQDQYRLAQVRFQSGITNTPNQSPLLEVSDAQSALTQAQTNDVTAHYDRDTALAQLLAAEGADAWPGGERAPAAPGAAP
ncbi:MAG: TolC family protein [Armatimonadetes bacterium]|nr:TolC family protein [Armatimonadota bacterium]MDE2207553.1 TolC family protein [Armatimonadota bacterium]